MAMDNPPAVCFAAKHHGRSQFFGGRLSLRSDAGTNNFLLYKVRKLGTHHSAYFLPGASAIGIFLTDPAQPIRDVLPSTFHAAKAAAKGNVIRMGP
jgi:hypothetical protein